MAIITEIVLPEETTLTPKPQVSYDDDIALAALEPPDGPLRQELFACGVEIVDPASVGHDYPYSLQIANLVGAPIDKTFNESITGSTNSPADCSKFGLEISTVAQCQGVSRVVAKSVIARDPNEPQPTTLGKHVWSVFDNLGIRVRCIPGTVQTKTDRKLNPTAEKRCGNCALHDKEMGQSEYTAVTHEDEPFGGDRQMWKDIADREARNRKIRRLEPEHVVFCMEHDAILDERLEACDAWVEDE